MHTLAHRKGMVIALTLLFAAACSRSETLSPAPKSTATEPPASPRPALTATPTAASVPPSATPPLPTATLTPTVVLPPTATPTAPATPTTFPSPDVLSSSRELNLPILMYHYVEPLPLDADELRQGLTVTPEQFAAQLEFLTERGYQSVSLYDLMNALATGAPLPPHPVIFTFDDGYTGLYSTAFPLMQQYGFTGTLFLITEFIDFGNPAYLTWPQAEEMAAAGWQLEPHTKTHIELPGQSRDQLVYQILGSMQTVQHHLGGSQPRFFAYPAGKYDDVVIGILQEVGFWGAVTTEPGLLHQYSDRFTFSRIRVLGTETLSDFAIRMGAP